MKIFLLFPFRIIFFDIIEHNSNLKHFIQLNAFYALLSPLKFN